MAATSEISQVRALLNAVRLRIELLRKEANRNPHDETLWKLLKEAKTEESMMLAKLAEWTLN